MISSGHSLRRSKARSGIRARQNAEREPQRRIRSTPALSSKLTSAPSPFHAAASPSPPINNNASPPTPPPPTTTTTHLRRHPPHWRRAWGEGDFPFLYVQLANYKANPAWPELREAQRLTLCRSRIPPMITIDIGNPTNIHPNQQTGCGPPPGASAARVVAYGEKIEDSGPMFRGPVLKATRCGSGSTTRPAAWSPKVWSDQRFRSGPEQTANTCPPTRGSKAVLFWSGTSTMLKTPVYVRYAWADNPDCNLYNGENLPASPFRSAIISPQRLVGGQRLLSSNKA